MSPLAIDSTENDLTYRIIGAAMSVHNALGYGYKEEVYEKALQVELQKLGMAAEAQYPLSVYHGGEQVGVFYLDLLVENRVVVEVKAFSHLLTNDERAQVINYLKASGAEVGMLFNFGRRKLEYRRIFPGKWGEEAEAGRIGRDTVIRPKG